MRVISTPLWLQKAGNEPGEYEDAFQPVASAEYEGDYLRFAVADGATEAMLSGMWAGLLVKLYRRHWQDPECLTPWLERAYTDWARLKREYINRRTAQKNPIRWYEEPGLDAGAFSTLLGLTLRRSRENGRGTFQAVALGDSCLVQIRAGELLLTFPFVDSGEFNDRPLLLSSNPERNRTALEHLRITRGDFSSGDCFYLMTDALAAWFMRECETGHEPWLDIQQLAPERFGEWIMGQREARQLRNDDVTCLCLSVI